VTSISLACHPKNDSIWIQYHKEGPWPNICIDKKLLVLKRLVDELNEMTCIALMNTEQNEKCRYGCLTSREWWPLCML